MATGTVMARRKLPSDRGYTELNNLTEPHQLKLLNDMIMYLFEFLGYGMTDEGEWMSGGVSGGGGEITGDDIDLTVRNFYLADVDNKTGDLDMVLSPDGIGAAMIYAQKFLQNGRPMVLPHGDYILYVNGASAMTYGKILPASEPAGDDNALWFRTVNAALDSLPRVIDGDVTITVMAGSTGAFAEPIVIQGFSGAGRLTIIGPVYAAALYVKDCSCSVDVVGLRAAPQNAASVLWHKNLGIQAPVHVDNSTVTLDNAIIVGNNNLYSGAYVLNSTLLIKETSINNCIYCVMADYFARVVMENCRGTGNTAVLAFTNPTSVIHTSGTVPNTSISWPDTPSWMDSIQPMVPVADIQIVTSYLYNVLLPAVMQLIGRINVVWHPSRSGGLNSGTSTMAAGTTITRTAAVSRKEITAVYTSTYANEEWATQNLYQGTSGAGAMMLGRMRFSSVTWSGNLYIARLRLTRMPTAGNPWPVPLYLVGLKGGDGEEPQVEKYYGVIATPAWGEKRYYDIPTSAATDLRDGVITALGFYDTKAATCGIYGKENPNYAPQLILISG